MKGEVDSFHRPTMIARENETVCFFVVSDDIVAWRAVKQFLATWAGRLVGNRQTRRQPYAISNPIVSHGRLRRQSDTSLHIVVRQTGNEKITKGTITYARDPRIITFDFRRLTARGWLLATGKARSATSSKFSTSRVCANEKPNLALSAYPAGSWVVKASTLPSANDASSCPASSLQRHEVLMAPAEVSHLF